MLQENISNCEELPVDMIMFVGEFNKNRFFISNIYFINIHIYYVKKHLINNIAAVCEHHLRFI